jgi:sugar phosphate permease
MIVAALVEICASSISFWLPTLFTSELGFSKDFANMLFSGISIARALMPFVALIIFKLIKERDIAMLLVTFGIAAAGFALMTLAPNRWILIILLVPALMACSCSAALLWSIYIPSLGKTGKVSSVNGVIDCIGYIAAACANLLFARVMGGIGWNTVYILWASVGVIGLIATFVLRRNKENTENPPAPQKPIETKNKR